MAGQKYNKAYEAYQQAVYRDGRNPTFWCSIGVLYFQINQFRDALDAYSRAIRINPYISEVWFDLGSLYESCNNQITDAIDAYARAAELDPGNVAIAQRLQLLKNAQATGGQLPAAPGPQDVHPTAYASSVVPPANLNGPPLILQPNNHRPQFRSDSRGPPNDVGMPPAQVNPSNRSSPPAPFRGGPPPPVIIDESRHVPSHTPLAPMDVDRPSHHNPREYPMSRDHQSLLLQHPLPPQGPSDDPRNGAHPHHPDPFYGRNAPGPRPPSRSVSPRARSPGLPYQGYPPSSRQPVGPNPAPPQRSPRVYHHREISHAEPDIVPGWDRRPPPPSHGDPREWERESHEHRRREYPPHPGGPGHQGGPPPPYSNYPRSPRAHSPTAPSPRHQPRYWEGKPPSNAGPPPPPHPHQHFRPSSPHPHSHSHPPPPSLAPSRSRYDPRQDARETREFDERTGYPLSPEGVRARNGAHHAPPPVVVGPTSSSRPVSPQIDKSRRRKDREEMQQQHVPPPQVQQVMPHQFQPPPLQASTMEAPKKERRKRTNGKRKDESSQESHRGYPPERVPSVSGGFKQAYPKGPGSPENSSNSSSSRSIQPSPTSLTPRQVLRPVDEDYDEGVADALIHLSNSSSNPDGPSHSPTISSYSRHTMTSPRMPPSHRNSVSSTHTSPPAQIAPLKRALSPGPDESSDNSKRSRVGVDHVSSKRRITSPSGGKRTPVSSTRPSPTPFIRQQPQPSLQSEAAREQQQQQQPPFTASPSLPVVLPPHPRPIGSHGQSLGGGSASVQLALPPIATLSPPSSAPSPTNHSDDKMYVDRLSSSPHGKLAEVVRGSSSRSPSTKQLHSHSQSPPSEKEPSS